MEAAGFRTNYSKNSNPRFDEAWKNYANDNRWNRNTKVYPRKKYGSTKKEVCVKERYFLEMKLDNTEENLKNKEGRKEFLSGN